MLLSLSSVTNKALRVASPSPSVPLGSGEITHNCEFNRLWLFRIDNSSLMADAHVASLHVTVTHVHITNGFNMQVFLLYKFNHTYTVDSKRNGMDWYYIKTGIDDIYNKNWLYTHADKITGDTWIIRDVKTQRGDVYLLWSFTNKRYWRSIFKLKFNGRTNYFCYESGVTTEDLK